MKISEIKDILAQVEGINFQLESGEMVPAHFHVTEVGMISKDFIDCGGTVRHEKVANFQLWDADDFEHRLKPEKLLNIIGLSERVLGMENSEIEVEYQAETIGRYDLTFDGTNFILVAKKTACLAMDQCDIPKPAKQHGLINLATPANSCTPGGGCC